MFIRLPLSFLFGWPLSFLSFLLFPLSFLPCDSLSFLPFDSLSFLSFVAATITVNLYVTSIEILSVFPRLLHFLTNMAPITKQLSRVTFWRH